MKEGWGEYIFGDQEGGRGERGKPCTPRSFV